MNFTVEYRDATTKQRKTLVLDVGSKSEVWAILKERGISAISVTEGGSSKSKKPGVKRGLAAGVIIAVLGCAIAWFLTRDTVKQPEPEVQKQKKEKVTTLPDVVIQTAEEVVAPITNVVEKKIDDDKYRDERGILRYKATGTRAYDPDRPTRKINLNMGKDGKPLYKPSPFKTRAENEIYRLIKIEPGETLFGERRYDEHFEAEYLKSLETPIVIEDEDDEDTVAAKKAMIAVKEEINERMKNGETLAEILTETKSELKRLADIKRMIRAELIESIKSGDCTEKDVENYLNAANMILEEKGIAPIKENAIIRMNMMIKAQKGKTNE